MEGFRGKAVSSWMTIAGRMFVGSILVMAALFALLYAVMLQRDLTETSTRFIVCGEEFAVKPGFLAFDYGEREVSVRRYQNEARIPTYVSVRAIAPDQEFPDRIDKTLEGPSSFLDQVDFHSGEWDGIVEMSGGCRAHFTSWAPETARHTHPRPNDWNIEISWAELVE